MDQGPLGNQDQQSLAAMMALQMSMGAPMPTMPMWPPPPMVSSWLNVRVDGLKFEYQLTEDDVRKVFSRYGDVIQVKMDREGTTSQVQFGQPHQAMAAQHDLDRKQLAGMSGAFLTVEFAPTAGGYTGGLPPQFDPALAHMAAAAQNPFMPPVMPGMGGYPMGLPPASVSPTGGQPKKYTCKLEVGIDNEGEFRVGSRVIQIARQIWQDPKFQEYGGKTRLRGKGIGGPHEGDEPLALCISCRDSQAFEKAVSHAESQLQKVHADYKAFCESQGKPVPDLSIKISKKGMTGADMGAISSNVSRGERPPGAPTDAEIEDLIEQRNDARKSANFKKADEVRDILKARGVVLMDEKGAKGTFKGNEVTKWRFWRP